MSTLYNCGESIIRKYTLIVCRVLPSRNGLFDMYIHAPRGHRLMDTIRKFRDLTGLPNVMGAIDGTHILLSTRPQRGLTPMPCDFFNMKKNSLCVITSSVGCRGSLWNVCAGSSVECTMLLSLLGQKSIRS